MILERVAPDIGDVDGLHDIAGGGFSFKEKVDIGGKAVLVDDAGDGDVAVGTGQEMEHVAVRKEELPHGDDGWVCGGGGDVGWEKLWSVEGGQDTLCDVADEAIDVDSGVVETMAGFRGIHRRRQGVAARRVFDGITDCEECDANEPDGVGALCEGEHNEGALVEET